MSEAAAKAGGEAGSSLITPSVADVATKTDVAMLKAELAEVKAELEHRLLIVALTIVGANITALAVATGIVIRVLG